MTSATAKGNERRPGDQAASYGKQPRRDQASLTGKKQGRGYVAAASGGCGTNNTGQAGENNQPASYGEQGRTTYRIRGTEQTAALLSRSERRRP